ETPEPLYGGLQCLLDRGLVGDVAADTEERVVAVLIRDPSVDVEAHDGGPAVEQRFGGGAPDAGGGPGDERDLPRKRRRRAVPVQLRLLELPVLDVEQIALGARLPIIERNRALPGIRRVQCGA